MARRTDATAADVPAEPTARKVQLAGGSTYTVSLPKAWADEHGIDAGTELYLQPRGDGSLKVTTTPTTDDGDRTVTVAVDDNEPADLARTARAMYVAGHDTVTFVGDGTIEPAARRAVDEAVTVLVGAEVVESTADRVVVRSLLSPDEVSLHQSLLQLRHVALAMHEDACSALFARSVDPQRVVERDDEADRLFGLVARFFQRGLDDPTVVEALDTDRETLFAYYRVARQLERVGDHAEKLAALASEECEPLDDALAAYAGDARSVVEDAASPLVGDAPPEAAFRALDDRDAVLEALHRFDRSIYQGTADYRISLVVDSLSRTAEYGGNIANTAIKTLVGE